MKKMFYVIMNNLEKGVFEDCNDIKGETYKKFYSKKEALEYINSELSRETMNLALINKFDELNLLNINIILREKYSTGGIKSYYAGIVLSRDNEIVDTRTITIDDEFIFSVELKAVIEALKFAGELGYKFITINYVDEMVKRIGIEDLNLKAESTREYFHKLFLLKNEYRFVIAYRKANSEGNKIVFSEKYKSFVQELSEISRKSFGDSLDNERTIGEPKDSDDKDEEETLELAYKLLNMLDEFKDDYDKLLEVHYQIGRKTSFELSDVLEQINNKYNEIGEELVSL